MIVGTEGTTTELPEQAGDPTAGKGNPRNEGESEPPDPAQTGADQPGETAQAKSGSQTGADAAQGGPPKKPDKKDQTQVDQSSPSGGAADDARTTVAMILARAEALKPLESASADLYSPDKEQARVALETAYAASIAKGGELRVKLDKARKDFERAAADILPRLADWVKLFDDGEKIGLLLKRRKKLEAELTKRMGEREGKRFAALANAKLWADAYSNWSTPVQKMTALIGEYADKINELSAKINTSDNPDAAILSFWLEVAPKHLQLDDKPLSTKEAQDAVDQVSNALKPYGLDIKLKNGSQRGDGSLYLAPDLTKARRGVLDSWVTAAEGQALADAKFKLDPDDAASVKQESDKLKDDGWIAVAKGRLEPTN